MICPKCGKEMERGKIASQEGKGLFFMPPDKLVLGEWVREKNIVKEGGIVLDGGEGRIRSSMAVQHRQEHMIVLLQKLRRLPVIPP